MYEKILIRIKLIYHNLNVGIIDNSGNHTHSQALLVSNFATSSHQMPNYCVWIDGIWSIINCIYYKLACNLHMRICISRKLPRINNYTECLFITNKSRSFFGDMLSFTPAYLSIVAGLWSDIYCTLLSQCRIWLLVITVFGPCYAPWF